MKYHPCCDLNLTEAFICGAIMCNYIMYICKFDPQLQASGPCMVGSLTGAVAS